MNRAIITAVCLLALAACGSSDDTTAPATTEAPTTTVAATLVTEPPTMPTLRPTTTTAAPAAISRDTKVAAQRCLDHFFLPRRFIVDLQYGSDVQAVIDDCNEAALQAGVDGPGDLPVALSTLNVELAAAKLQAAIDPDVLDADAFVDEVTPTLTTIEALIAAA